MSELRKVKKNSSFVLGGKIINTLISLAITFLLARYLGKSLFGSYAFILALLHIFLMLLNTWIEPIAVREMSKSSSNGKNDITGNIILLHITFVTIFSLALLIYSQTTGQIDVNRTYLLFTIILLFINGLTTSYKYLFRSELKMHYYIIPNCISNILFLILSIFIIALKGPLSDIFISLIISHLLLLFTVMLISKKIIKAKFKSSFPIIKKVLTYSWPLALTALFTAVLYRIDQLMLFSIQGNTSLGNYAAAARISEAFNIIPLALASSILPVLTKYYQSNSQKFKTTYTLSFKYLALLIIPFSTLAILFPKKIITVVYGQDFITAAPALSILMCAEIFYFFGMVNRQILIASNKQKLDPLFTGLSAIINVVLNLILIPKWGFKGAAIATLIASAAGPFTGYFINTTRNYSYTMFHYSLKPLFLCIVAGAIINTTDSSFIISLIIFPLAYIVGLYIIRGLNRKDLLLLKSFIQKQD